MALLASAGDVSGAESPVGRDGMGASWPPRGSALGGRAAAAAAAGAAAAEAIMPPLSLPSLPLPPPPRPLSAHRLSDSASSASSTESDSDSDPGGAATSASSVFTLCNSAIGAGVLSLPFAFRRAGLGGGLLLCGSVGAAEAFTLCVFFFLAIFFGVCVGGDSV